MARKKYAVVVVFGEEAANAYGWGDMKRMYGLIREYNGSLTKRTFDTEAERKAYIRGIDDADGWIGSAVLSDADAKKRTISRLLNV